MFIFKYSVRLISRLVLLVVSHVGIIVSCADLRDCRAIRDILCTVLLIGNFLNAVSTKNTTVCHYLELHSSRIRLMETISRHLFEFVF